MKTSTKVKPCPNCSGRLIKGSKEYYICPDCGDVHEVSTIKK